VVKVKGKASGLNGLVSSSAVSYNIDEEQPD
jgi:hypothetical protein